MPFICVNQYLTFQYLVLCVCSFNELFLSALAYIFVSQQPLLSLIFEALFRWFFIGIYILDRRVQRLRHDMALFVICNTLMYLTTCLGRTTAFIQSKFYLSNFHELHWCIKSHQLNNILEPAITRCYTV